MTIFSRRGAAPSYRQNRRKSSKAGKFAAPNGSGDEALQFGDWRRGIVYLNRSPLARKIIVFNLVALVSLMAGILFVNPFRDSLVLQREAGLMIEAKLLTAVFEATLAAPAAPDLGALAQKTLGRVELSSGVEVFVFDAAGNLHAKDVGRARPSVLDEIVSRSTIIGDFFSLARDVVEDVRAIIGGERPGRTDAEGLARAIFANAVRGKSTVSTGRGVADGAMFSADGAMFSVAAPILQDDRVLGVVALTSAAGEIDKLVRFEREQVLQTFLIALLVSIGLSLVLASTIANPLSDLAAAAERGRDRNARRMDPGRVRIPDLAARPDEIGRLSEAMRGMVAALYDRIDANEQFAADVAHEIKNPLASLRSAVGTMRVSSRRDHRERLLDVVEHDVRRLDRLVSDISNASRLDAELVKEQETTFNLLNTLANLGVHMGRQAIEAGLDLITDLPAHPIMIQGLEGRLAQVFVNLIGNAISFCEAGDAVRVWVRQRENRVLIVVEDTGPGIPEQSLGKIFDRFYSERPEGQFGNHSGLGLAISKQIVEAHGGVIWAENIRPTNADMLSEPLGARFVVGLPV